MSSRRASELADARRRILIVCHANVSRSIIAEALLRKMLAERGRDDVGAT